MEIITRAVSVAASFGASGQLKSTKCMTNIASMATKASGVLKENLKILFNLSARCRRAQSFILASRPEWNKFPSLRLQFAPEAA